MCYNVAILTATLTEAFDDMKFNHKLTRAPFKLKNLQALLIEVSNGMFKSL